jgi:hypothetical protein
MRYVFYVRLVNRLDIKNGVLLRGSLFKSGRVN